MYHNRPEFASAVAANAWLKENTDVVVASKILVEWALELIAEHAPEAKDSLQYIEVHTATELRKALAPYTTSKSVHRNLNSQPALWPLVDKVVVGIKGVRLLEHLIFADLPGVEDKNSTRVATTREHLHKCDVVWVIASIDRVVSSNSLATELDRTFERFGDTDSNRVAVICTHSDQKTDGTLKDLKNKRYNIVSPEAVRKSVQMLEREVKKQNTILKKVKTDTEKVRFMENIKKLE